MKKVLMASVLACSLVSVSAFAASTTDEATAKYLASAEAQAKVNYNVDKKQEKFNLEQAKANKHEAKFEKKKANAISTDVNVQKKSTKATAISTAAESHSASGNSSAGSSAGAAE